MFGRWRSFLILYRFHNTASFHCQESTCPGWSCLVGDGASQATILYCQELLSYLLGFCGKHSVCGLIIKSISFPTVCPDCLFFLLSFLRWIVTLSFYITRKGRFDCHGGAVLHSYIIVLLVLLGVIIITLCAVVYVSAQGKSRVYSPY